MAVNVQEQNEFEIKEIINEDGTIFDPPENPLKEKWDKLYPPTRYGVPCSPYFNDDKDGYCIPNYSCVLCYEKTCPHSKGWKVPDEDKEVYDKYCKECEEYMKLHNPNAEEKIKAMIKRIIKEEGLD